MKQQRSRLSGREIGLLLLPVVFLSGIALLANKNLELPELNPNPIHIEIENIEHEIAVPATDIRVFISMRTAGYAPFTNRNDWDWFEEVNLVAVQNGKVRIISDSWNTISTVRFKPIFVSGGSSSGTEGNQNYHKREWKLRLRDIPADWGELELRGKMAFGPHDNGVWPTPPVKTTKSIIAYIERRKNGLIVPIRIPLKRHEIKKAR